MTKVTLPYSLSRPLSDSDLASIADLHSVYGIARVQIAPSLDKITVDYDASRLTRLDVEKALMSHGLPLQASAVA